MRTGKVGLALGGGSVRGAAHIGVLRELDSMRIQVSSLAGTSAGAIFAALYAAGAEWRSVEEATRSIDWRLFAEPAYLWRRSIEARSLMQLIDKLLGGCRRFQDLRLPLRIVAVDLISGKAIAISEGPLLPAIRASIAVPGIFSPVDGPDGTVLVDGGLLDPVPAAAVRSMDSSPVLAVDVRGGRTPFRPRQAGQAIKRRRILQRCREVLEDAAWGGSLAAADLILRPAVQHVSPYSLRALPDCIEAGAEAVRRMRGEILRLALEAEDAERSSPRPLLPGQAEHQIEENRHHRNEQGGGGHHPRIVRRQSHQAGQ